MNKKAWCTCKVVVLPCHAIAYLTFSSPLHRNQIELVLLIASETFFDSSQFLRFWLGNEPGKSGEIIGSLTCEDESRRASTAKTRRLPSNDFSFLLWLLFTLSDSIILRKCTTMVAHTNVFFHPTWVGESTWVPTSMYLNRPRPKFAVWATGASTLRAASKTWSHGTNLPLILLQVIQDGNTILNTTCEATL